MNKTIPKKKKSKKAKWLFVEAFQIAKERRNVKSKGERERYIQLNAELQGMAWRDKKASRRDGKNTQKNRTKKNLMHWITMMVLSVTQRQIYWRAKSSGP